MNLQNKKLLVLGANAETIAIVKNAKEKGIITYVTDYIVNSPAKKVSDYYWDINGKDMLSICDKIIENHIDGIIVGVADPLINTYFEICSRLKLPCLVNKAIIDLCSSKSTFKNICSRYNIKTIKEYFIGEKIYKIIEKNIKYPCLVKPEISRGGKGIYKCNDFLELKENFCKAKLFSDNGRVICEEFIQAEDCVATFIIANNIVKCVALSDRYLLKNSDGIPTVTISNQFPSKYSELFNRNEFYKYERMFSALNISNAIINIQMFRTEDSFIPYDPDCIINGECASPIINSVYGIDIIGNLIEYSLTGMMKSISNVYSDGFGMSWWILLKAGHIDAIIGKEDVESMREVINILWKHDVDDYIDKNLEFTESATLARIWIKTKDKNKSFNIINKIVNTINVLDGENQMQEDLRKYIDDIYSCNM